MSEHENILSRKKTFFEMRRTKDISDSNRAKKFIFCLGENQNEMKSFFLFHREPERPVWPDDLEKKSPNFLKKLPKMEPNLLPTK